MPPTPPDRRGSRRLPLVVAGTVLVVAVFLADAWPRIGAAFGDSHDGRNAAVWTLGADSLRDHGPVTSRVGAWAELRGTYANHPPLIYPLTALSRSVSEHPAATRAPAWLASALALAALVRLLRKTGASDAAAVGAAAAVAGTPMFLVFGPMLNMEALSLPAALGLLLAWQSPVWPSARRTGAVAAAGALLSWQGVVLGGLLGAVAVVRCVRGRRRPLPHETGTVAGTAAGTALTVGWLWWANGGFGAVLSQGRTRSGDGTFGMADFVGQQLAHLGATVPVWTLTVAAVGAWLLARRGLPLVAVASAACVAAFAVVFSHGAVHHVYWNYLLLVPLALAVAPALDEFARRAGRSGPAVVAAAGVLALGAGTVVRTPLHDDIDAGLEVLAVAQADPFGGTTAPYACTIGTSGWLAWATGRPAAALDRDGLARLAAADADTGVYVVAWAVPGDDAWARVRGAAAVAGAGSAWIAAGDLAVALGPEPCA
jgi:hypothetical protein